MFPYTSMPLNTTGFILKAKLSINSYLVSYYNHVISFKLYLSINKLFIYIYVPYIFTLFWSISFSHLIYRKW